MKNEEPLLAPVCSCGRYMEPEFLNVSTFNRHQYFIEWYCNRHKEDTK